MRSVEATRCQLSLPILSCNISDPLPQLTGELQSIQSEQINFQNAVCLSGSEVIDAALAQQEDLYRTGGRMAEDYVAVAIIPRLKNGGKVVSKAYAIPDKVLREGTLAEKLQEQLSFHRLPKGELMTKRTVLANMDHLEFGLSLPGEAIVFEVSRCKLLAKELSMGGMLNSERLIEFVMSRLAGAQVKNVFEVIEEAQIQNLLDSDDKGVLFLPDPTEEELCAMAESCYFMPNAMLGLRDMLPKEALMWSLKDFSA